VQWNLSNPIYQGLREMCRIVQDVGILRCRVAQVPLVLLILGLVSATLCCSGWNKSKPCFCKCEDAKADCIKRTVPVLDIPLDDLIGKVRTVLHYGNCNYYFVVVVQWNLSNPIYQGHREMFRIVQDVGILRCRIAQVPLYFHLYQSGTDIPSFQTVLGYGTACFQLAPVHIFAPLLSHTVWPIVR
jgi:hypothetical protein